jgi:hypothetical protein
MTRLTRYPATDLRDGASVGLRHGAVNPTMADATDPRKPDERRCTADFCAKKVGFRCACARAKFSIFAQYSRTKIVTLSHAKNPSAQGLSIDHISESRMSSMHLFVNLGIISAGPPLLTEVAFVRAQLGYFAAHCFKIGCAQFLKKGSHVDGFELGLPTVPIKFCDDKDNIQWRDRASAVRGLLAVSG